VFNKITSNFRISIVDFLLIIKEYINFKKIFILKC